MAKLFSKNFFGNAAQRTYCELCSMMLVDYTYSLKKKFVIDGKQIAELRKIDENLIVGLTADGETVDISQISTYKKFEMSGMTSSDLKKNKMGKTPVNAVRESNSLLFRVMGEETIADKLLLSFQDLVFSSDFADDNIVIPIKEIWEVKLVGTECLTVLLNSGAEEEFEFGSEDVNIWKTEIEKLMSSGRSNSLSKGR
jgi:hypothetical protein